MTITHPTDNFQVLDGFVMDPNVAGSTVVRFYVDHDSGDKTDLDIETNAVYYVPFLVQSQ